MILVRTKRRLTTRYVNGNTCLICGEPVQGRKRRDARVCVGECAKTLAIARTMAWKARRPFSVRKGIVPLDDEQRSATPAVSERPKAVAVPVGIGTWSPRVR
jgi:hypothetical protein